LGGTGTEWRRARGWVRDGAAWRRPGTVEKKGSCDPLTRDGLVRHSVMDNHVAVMVNNNIELIHTMFCVA
jgi:hypothetical protein